MPYIRMMEDNYVLFDIIADGNFFFPEKKKCWNPLKDQCTHTNDLKLILPEKAYSTNESFTSTLMSLGSADSRNQDWDPESDSEVISMDFEDTESV